MDEYSKMTFEYTIDPYTTLSIEYTYQEKNFNAEYISSNVNTILDGLKKNGVSVI